MTNAGRLRRWPTGSRARAGARVWRSMGRSIFSSESVACLLGWFLLCCCSSSRWAPVIAATACFPHWSFPRTSGASDGSWPWKALASTDDPLSTTRLDRALENRTCDASLRRTHRTARYSGKPNHGPGQTQKTKTKNSGHKAQHAHEQATHARTLQSDPKHPRHNTYLKKRRSTRTAHLANQKKGITKEQPGEHSTKCETQPRRPLTPLPRVTAAGPRKTAA